MADLKVNITLFGQSSFIAIFFILSVVINQINYYLILTLQQVLCLGNKELSIAKDMQI